MLRYPSDVMNSTMNKPLIEWTPCELMRVSRRTASGCLIWPFSVDGAGYPIINTVINGKHTTKKVHRIIFEATNRPLQEREYACHVCDTPACIEPTHLFAGSNLINIQDKVSKRRQARKLTAEHAVQILNAYKQGTSQKDIAAKFNVHQSLISLIVTGKHVPKV